MDRVQDLVRGVNVAVIGAGWAGLAAAVELARRSIRVEVFEAARHPGGRARTVHIDGITLDNGQHILVGAYEETLRLMRLVGADPEKLLLRLPFNVDYPGRFRMRAPHWPAPLHLAAALLQARGLTWRERLAATRFMLKMRVLGYRTAAELTVAELLIAQGQTGALARYLWEPLCVSALNTPAHQASAQVFLNVLRDALGGARANSDLLIPQADLGALFPQPAGDYLRAHGGELHLGRAVRHIERKDGGYTLDAGTRRFSHVVLAAAPRQVDALIASFPELAQLRQCISAFAYEPIYTCYLRYPPAVRMPQAMTGFGGHVLQWVFDRGQLNGPPGMIAAVISARGAHQELPQAALAAAVHKEIAAVIPGLASPVWSRVIAEKRATFACRPGMARPDHGTALDGLLLAGDYTTSDYPATLESAVRSGIGAAALVR